MFEYERLVRSPKDLYQLPKRTPDVQLPTLVRVPPVQHLDTWVSGGEDVGERNFLIEADFHIGKSSPQKIQNRKWLKECQGKTVTVNSVAVEDHSLLTQVV